MRHSYSMYWVILSLSILKLDSHFIHILKHTEFGTSFAKIIKYLSNNNTKYLSNMKHFKRKISVFIILAGISFTVLSQSFNQPVLISSAGQSADVKLVKMLAARQKLDANTVLMATPSDLEDVKSLIIVPGFSSKGLGAAGISQKDEMDRVKKLVEAANSKDIPIILMHIGGNARRKGQSDAFNSLIAEKSKHMIVVAQGNEDDFFTELASANNTPLEIVDKISEAATPLGKLFQ